MLLSPIYLNRTEELRNNEVIGHSDFIIFEKLSSDYRNWNSAYNASIIKSCAIINLETPTRLKPIEPLEKRYVDPTEHYLVTLRTIFPALGYSQKSENQGRIACIFLFGRLRIKLHQYFSGFCGHMALIYYTPRTPRNTTSEGHASIPFQTRNSKTEIWGEELTLLSLT